MCPDENTLAAMIQGFLEPEQLQALEAHLDACPACLELVADLAPMLQTVTDLPKIGRYEILHELGSGAQGVVYAAFDPDLQHQVAIKIVRPDRGQEEGRVLVEARLLATLSHAHVVSIYEIGPWPGGVYMVTELVRGGTLRSWASPGRPWREVVQVWLGAGRGLAAAHRAGLVHRDVKPDNLLLHEDGRAMLTDFGLASTQPGREVQGTPIYLAPELAQGAPADARSDQFAFCVGLYEALHGTRPFPGSALRELHEHAQQGHFGPRRRGVPARVTAVVERGLRADPRERFPSMEALLEALEGTLPARVAPAIFAGTLSLLGLALLGWVLWEPAPVPVAPPAPPPPQAQAALHPCDTLVQQSQPMLEPCGESPTCQEAQFRRVLELAQCYEMYSVCAPFHEWLGVAERLKADPFIAAWRTSSMPCPPEHPRDQVVHHLRFGGILLMQGAGPCREVGARARQLLPAADPEQRDKLWALQLDAIRLLMYAHRHTEEAQQEAQLAEQAFARTVDWQALSRQ